jgi:hypothetical protein
MAKQRAYPDRRDSLSLVEVFLSRSVQRDISLSQRERSEIMKADDPLISAGD